MATDPVTGEYRRSGREKESRVMDWVKLIFALLGLSLVIAVSNVMFEMLAAIYGR